MRKFNIINQERGNAILRKEIIELLINDGDNCIAEISKRLNSSIPTITKQINQMMKDSLLIEKGKQDTNGGRRPIKYGLNPDAGYFIGVDIQRFHISIAVMQFDGNLLDYTDNIPFQLEKDEECLRRFCTRLHSHLKSRHVPIRKIVAYGMNLSGRVNTTTGQSFSFCIKEDTPLSENLKELLGCPVYLDNDSRAMTYGEHLIYHNKVKDMLFLNLTWGLGMGMIVNGRIVNGKSGFAGEIGHVPMLNNNQICQCGKIGCLETGASGMALQRILIDKIKAGKSSKLSEVLDKKGTISTDEILQAINEEDVLAIESMEEIGNVLGRAIAGLINIFNPELVVIGGALSRAGDYLMIPIKGAVNKLSLHYVNEDTRICLSALGKKAGPIGACMLSRSKVLDLV